MGLSGMKLRNLINTVRQFFCKHNFAEMDTEYNKASKQIGCGNAISYKCSKCGKIVWMRW